MPLWITLLLAAIQGVILVWLHNSVDAGRWPATDFRWLTSIYVVTVLAPLTIHLLAAHWRNRVLWLAVAGIAVTGALTGWQLGSNVAVAADSLDSYAWVFGFTLAVVWLLCMPFLRCRLEHGRWRVGYQELFAAAWQGKLLLLEGALFTGVFWLLLALWAALFKSVGYDFFKDVFTNQVFVYPFTAITLAGSLRLVGSVERLVSVAREQILGLLKWLAPVAALILLLFTPTLLAKLPQLLQEGERAIGAVWLLWLVAVTILLLNAGYQDGSGQQGRAPYPAWLANSLRFVTPLMTIVALLALYALIVRVQEHGITVMRAYGLVVAVSAVLYSVGYSAAAFTRGPWMRLIESVNVAVAVVLIVTLLLTLTPVLSPYRLAANSQASRVAQLDPKEREAALRYLQFDAGQYGRRKVSELSSLQGGDEEAKIAVLARKVARQQSRYVEPELSLEDVEKLPVYPPGRTVDDQLRAAIIASRSHDRSDETSAVVFVDLTEDGQEECVVLMSHTGLVFKRDVHGVWARVGASEGGWRLTEDDRLQAELARGAFGPSAPRLNDLRIGDVVFRVQALDKSEMTTAVSVP